MSTQSITHLQSVSLLNDTNKDKSKSPQGKTDTKVSVIANNLSCNEGNKIERHSSVKSRFSKLGQEYANICEAISHWGEIHGIFDSWDKFNQVFVVKFLKPITFTNEGILVNFSGSYGIFFTPFYLRELKNQKGPTVILSKNMMAFSLRHGNKIDLYNLWEMRNQITGDKRLEQVKPNRKWIEIKKDLEPLFDSEELNKIYLELIQKAGLKILEKGLQPCGSDKMAEFSLGEIRNYYEDGCKPWKLIYPELDVNRSVQAPFKIIPTAKDGSCLYESLIVATHYLNIPLKVENKADLRKKIAEYIEGNQEMFIDEVITMLTDEYISGYKSGIFSDTLPAAILKAFNATRITDLSNEEKYKTILKVKSEDELILKNLWNSVKIEEHQDFYKLSKEVKKPFLACWSNRQEIIASRKSWFGPYVKGMAIGNSYGGPVEVLAFQKMTGITIRVYTSLDFKSFISFGEDENRAYEMKRTIHLLRPIDFPHYEFLVPTLQEK